MKKFCLIFALMLTFVMGANAQTAVQTQKWYDNISVGVGGGVMTPLSFNSTFPLNAFAGLRVQKDFSPVIGMQIDGNAMFNTNNDKFVAPAKTFVKSTIVGANAVWNLTNTFAGYTGTPRFLEVSAVAGPMWIHEFETTANYLGAKTALDIAFNLGKDKANAIVLTPAVYWNLNKLGHMEFNKNLSQVSLMATFVHKFKTSNGTHNFKLYDVGAMNDEINNLRAENQAKDQTIADRDNEIKLLIEQLANQPKPKDGQEVKYQTIFINESHWVVFFSKGSAELTDEAKAQLKNIPQDLIVDVVGTASPEGSAEFNQKLSEERAQNVAAFLKDNGVKVNKVEGKGVVGDSSNRVAIISAAK